MSHPLNQQPAGPFSGAIALGAAALGASAAWLDQTGHHALAALSPSDLDAWTKSIANVLFTLVNTLVGCYQLIAWAKVRHRHRKSAPAPAKPGNPQ